MARSNESLSSSDDIHVHYVFDTFSLLPSQPLRNSLNHSLSRTHHVFVCTCVGVCKSFSVSVSSRKKGALIMLSVCVEVRVCERVREGFWFVSGCNSFVGLQQSQSLCLWNWGSLILMRNPWSIFPALLLSQNLNCIFIYECVYVCMKARKRGRSQCSTIQWCLVCIVWC